MKNVQLILSKYLKLLEDLDTPLQIHIFIGDGHHNAMGIYRYLKGKGIIPIIPLDEHTQPKQPETTTTPQTTTTPEMKTKNTSVTPRPQIEIYPNITFEPDGTPLCPGGCRMRRQGYNVRKVAHIFACPCTRKNGKQQWVFHAQECPVQQDCTPLNKKMGHPLYIKSEADLRLFPPIPRDSTRCGVYLHQTDLRQYLQTCQYSKGRRRTADAPGPSA